MLNSQKISIRLSEVRQRLNELAGLETLTDEQRQESEKLQTEFADSEVRYRSAVIAEGSAEKADLDGDAETRELQQLTERANAGAIILAVTEKRHCLGAELELQQAHGLAENMIPLDMLRVEQRAAGLTTAPTNVGTSQAEIVAPVFANGAGAFLGIDRPTVAAGDAVYPVLATRPDVGGPHSDSTDVPETDSTFDSELLAPERIQASSQYRRVDAARFPNMDSALRMALNAGLEEKLDYEVLRGSEGLLTGSKLQNHNKTGETTHAQYLSQFCFGRVDGRYAAEQSDLKVLMGSGSYAHAGSTYQATPHLSALDALMAKIPVRVSAHVPAVASTKQNNVIRMGLRSDYVQPMWMGVTIIVDEISGSGTGLIEVTAVLLTNTKILRSNGASSTSSKSRFHSTPEFPVSVRGKSWDRSVGMQVRSWANL